MIKKVVIADSLAPVVDACVAGGVLFRSPNLGTALALWQHMVIQDLGGLTDAVSASLTHQRLVILLLATLVFLLPPAKPVTGRYLESMRSRPAAVPHVGVMTAGLLYSALPIVTGTFSPFLDYRF